MSRIDLSRYNVEFVRNFGFGYKTYTWFVSRRNYDRNGFYSSDTVWVYTTDFAGDYDDYKFGHKSTEDFIRFIKHNPTTKMYNDPVL